MDKPKHPKDGLVPLGQLVYKDYSFGPPPIPSLEIKTEFVNPPIPVRHMDWCAWVAGQEEEGIYGNGPTEEDAIQNLKDRLDQDI